VVEEPLEEDDDEELEEELVEEPLEEDDEELEEEVVEVEDPLEDDDELVVVEEQIGAIQLPPIVPLVLVSQQGVTGSLHLK